MHTGKRDNHSFDIRAQSPAFIVAGLCFLAVLVLGAEGLNTRVHDAVSLTGAAGAPFRLLPAVHIAFNSVIPFAVDPWLDLQGLDLGGLDLLSSFTGLSITQIYWAVLLGGMIACRNAISTLFAAATVLFIFGLDRTLIGVFAWVPFALLGVKRFERRGEVALLVVLLFIGMRLPYSAGPLLAVSMLIFLIIALHDRSPTFSREEGRTSDAKRATFALLAVTLGALITLRAVPNLPVFDYPKNVESGAALVPDDGLPGAPRPLIGPFYPVPVLDHAATTDFLLVPFGLVLLALLISLRRLTKPEQALACGVLLLAALELWGRGELGALSPLAAISRMVPGLFLYPCAALVIAIILWRMIAIHPPRNAAMFALLCIGLSALSRIVIAPATYGSLAEVAAEGLDGAKFTPAQISSPSQVVLRNELGKPSMRGMPLAFTRCAANVSAQINGRLHDSAALAALSDGNLKDRVSLGQAAGNTLSLCFAAAVPEAIWLDLGDFVTDFPQRFTITNKATGARIASFAPWLGPLRVTTLQGLPFYGPPSEVKILLPKQLPNGSCFDITLSERNRGFDWSVAELRCAQ